MVWSIREMMGNSVRYVWDKLTGLASYIFFQKPLELGKSRALRYDQVHKAYVYFLAFFIVPFYFVPWMGLATWYLVPVKGCEFHVSRQYLEGFCMPDLNSDTAMHWYKDLWNHQTDYADYLDTLPSHIEAIMISHLKIFDAQVSLLGLAAELDDNYSSGYTAKALKSSLDGVTIMLLDLAYQWESFSSTFCEEKDAINYAFRGFVEAYSTAITSKHQDLTYVSVIIFPWLYMFEFINNFFETSWLPQPKLYSLQVKAEIRFRLSQFIEESMAALDRIDKKSPTSRRFQTLTSRTLGGAINTTTAHQRDLEVKIAETPWRQRIQNPKHIKALRDTLALLKRVRKLIIRVKVDAETRESYSKRLRSQLQNFRESLKHSLSIELSSSAVLAFLDPLDDLDSTGEARIVTLRSRIAQVCQDSHHGNSVPRPLQRVCFLQAMGATFSHVDDDALASVQRSWVMERKEAIHRYKSTRRSDWDSQVDLGLEIYQAYKDAAPMPSDL